MGLEELEAAMLDAAAAGKGRTARDWARGYGVDRRAPYRVAARLGIPAALEAVVHRVALTGGKKGKRARLGQRDLMAAFGAPVLTASEVVVTIVRGEAGGRGGILLTLPE